MTGVCLRGRVEKALWPKTDKGGAVEKSGGGGENSWVQASFSLRKMPPGPEFFAA